jgi:acetyl-CoA synthetase
VASGGESLGGELLSWGRACLGVNINELYGQTECNMVISSCDAWFPSKAGAMGKPVVGHHVSVIDQEGRNSPPGVEGDIAILTPDPVAFLGYWRNPEATQSKFRGAWLITGDRGAVDDDGYMYFVGRGDDVITSAGYRIGPGEIEDCLLRHSAVSSVGVVGVPDATRTEVVTAFVVLATGVQASASLIAELQQHVRSRLGGHQYPRQVHFVKELPLTITGKIIRGQLRAWAINASGVY